MVFFTIKIFMMTKKHPSVIVCPSSLILLSVAEVGAMQKSRTRLPEPWVGGESRISVVATVDVVRF